MKELWNNFKSNKLHHAIILYGPDNTESYNIAYNLASQIILNESINIEFDKSQIKSNNHPNILIIKREIDNNKLKSHISIDSVRNISNFTNLTPFSSKYRIIIINSIDKMNKNASNALLKTLEEPSENIFLFLICDNINSISSTIKSRCNIIKIPAISYNNWKIEIRNSDEIQITDCDLDILYEISPNSISNSIIIHNYNGLKIYEDILKLTDNEYYISNIIGFINRISEDDNSWNVFKIMIFFFINRIFRKYSNININYIFDYEEKYLNRYISNNKIYNILNIDSKIIEIFKEEKLLNIDRKQIILKIFRLYNFYESEIS